jgi:hypothetical protein
MIYRRRPPALQGQLDAFLRGARLHLFRSRAAMWFRLQHERAVEALLRTLRPASWPRPAPLNIQRRRGPP